MVILRGRRDHGGEEREKYGLSPLDLLLSQGHLKLIEYVTIRVVQ
jgi:hypothetical protein